MSYLYGTYVGQAFQLIDDALDFEGEQLLCLVTNIRLLSSVRWCCYPAVGMHSFHYL